MVQGSGETPSGSPSATLSAFPGPIAAKMLQELDRYVIATPYPFAIDLEKCEGMWLVTVDGQRLFDWVGYYGSKLVGHNHPGLYEPSYTKRLLLAANNKVANPDFLTAECLDYYRALFNMAPNVMKGHPIEVYAVNSGAEAVENMMKYLVAMFNQKLDDTGKTAASRRFIYFDHAFHGRTVYALGVTQTVDPVATKDFHGLTSGGNLKLPFPVFNSDRSKEENLSEVNRALEGIESLLRFMADEIVGIIVEPIQGAGGHRVAMPEFFRGLSALAHQYDVYLGFDEVQTGLAATGKMWAIDHFDLPYPPQAVATGKKFGNGVVYMLEPLEDVGVLDSTWGGNLADMVRVVRELEIVEQENLMSLAASNGARLAIGLEKLVQKHQPILSNVRGLGLYQGFSLDTGVRKSKLIETARTQFGLLLLGAGKRSIRTRPNLSVTAEEIDLFVDLLDQAIAVVS
jgi:L-lysine 6-transaminase